MKRRIQHWTMALLFAVSVGGTFGVTALPQPAMAACGDARFLTIPAWYRGLTEESGGECNIKKPDNMSQFVWKIALNITEMLLHLIGYLTVGFIIYGGFKYMVSAGSSDGMAKAKTTITNAVIGLILSIVSIAIVNLVGSAIG
jgi:hypothetical protein